MKAPGSRPRISSGRATAFRRGAAAAIALLALAAAGPVRAAPGLAVTAAFNGGLTPSLDFSPRFVTHSFTGIAFVYGGLIGGRPAQGFANCSGTATSSAPETILFGAGAGSLSCLTFDDLNGGGDATCSFGYARAPGIMQMSAMSCSFTRPAGTQSGACEFAYQPFGFPAQSFFAEGACALL